MIGARESPSYEEGVLQYEDNLIEKECSKQVANVFGKIFACNFAKHLVTVLG